MKKNAYFITGTDTSVGKTYTTTRLLEDYTQKGYSTIGLKPVASGAIKKDGELINEDALLLQQASSMKLPLSEINPFTFLPPIAPHIAAKQENISLSCQAIAAQITNIMNKYNADYYFIEGAGGLLVPLNETETIADLITLMNIPLILVVGIRLGCINHALLTNDYIVQHNLPFAGWIANCLEADCAEQEEMMATLKNKMAAPCVRVMD